MVETSGGLRELVVAARRRGLTTARIAAEFGVTHQNVSKHIRREAKKTGDSSLLGRAGHGGRHYHARLNCRCAHCGVEIERTHKEVRRSRVSYCSLTCLGSHTREISDADTDWAMERRMAGESWKNISRALGHTYQAIQRRIWLRLHSTDRLTLDVVKSIWNSNVGRSGASWEHLVKFTGLDVGRGRGAGLKKSNA